MELFVTKSRKYGNCCCSYYGVIRLKCDRAPRSASETQINLNKRIKFHPAFTCSISAENTRNVSNIFKVNNKDTRTMSIYSIVECEYISYFILLLLLLNSNKQILFGPEKLQFQTINLFSVTMEHELSYELGTLHKKMKSSVKNSFCKCDQIH